MVVAEGIDAPVNLEHSLKSFAPLWC